MHIGINIKDWLNKYIPHNLISRVLRNPMGRSKLHDLPVTFQGWSHLQGKKMVFKFFGLTAIVVPVIAAKRLIRLLAITEGTIIDKTLKHLC